METILVDDSEVQDAEVLIDTLVIAIRERNDLKAVAFATNVDYQESEGGSRIDAIMFDIDHKGDRPITCVLPYVRQTMGELALGELFAVEARRTFFCDERQGLSSELSRT